METAVVGLPDPTWGEAVTAVVVARPDAGLTEAAVIAHCHQELAGHKCPKRVLFVDTLPKNAVGKVQKLELVRRLESQIPYDTILWDVRDRVAYVTLNRPDQLNALRFQMRAELAQAFEACAADDAIRAVVLAGAGRAFCAGVHLRGGSFEEMPIESVEVRVRGDFRAKLVGMGKPSIAAVQGFALGGGCELALCCDLRLAADDAQFGLPEINLGSIPAGGATQRLPRLIGATRTLELLMTGDRLPVEEAYRLGLVNRVVPRDALPVAAAELAEKLATKAPLAIRHLRQAVYSGLDLPLDDGIRLEAYLGGLLRTTEDRVEGLAAFREKLLPNFRGRWPSLRRGA